MSFCIHTCMSMKGSKGLEGLKREGTSSSSAEASTVSLDVHACVRVLGTYMCACVCLYVLARACVYVQTRLCLLMHCIYVPVLVWVCVVHLAVFSGPGDQDEYCGGLEGRLGASGFVHLRSTCPVQASTPDTHPSEGRTQNEAWPALQLCSSRAGDSLGRWEHWPLVPPRGPCGGAAVP